MITVLEELSEKYDSQKNYLLNQKKIIMINTQQILFSEEVQIKVNREVNVKLESNSDYIRIQMSYKKN